MRKFESGGSVSFSRMGGTGGTGGTRGNIQYPDFLVLDSTETETYNPRDGFFLEFSTGHRSILQDFLFFRVLLLRKSASGTYDSPKFLSSVLNLL